MSSFAELMKVAEQNTRSSNREATEAARRREATIRQAREEQEKKERAEKEFQKQQMLRRIEDAKKEEERKKRREEELVKRKEEIARKREQEGEQAKYSVAGPSKDGPKAKSSNPYIVVNGSALTREEKRMAKDPLLADRLKARNKQTSIKRRKDGKLPGGAINGGSPVSPSKGGPAAMTARARLSTQFAPTLTKLNTEKRDTRTIDEITRDLKRGKLGGPSEKDLVLSGDKAQAFGDWFGKKDKAADIAEVLKRKGNGSSKEPPKASGSGATTSQNARSSRPAVTASGSSSTKTAPRKPLVGGASSSKPQKLLSGGMSGSRKRSRERSMSLEDDFIEDEEDDYDSEEERRYAKRSSGARGSAELQETQRDMIWQIMGKNRRQYTAIDVDSDDDMEVSRADLEKEELRSARIAKREDAEAEEEERRRELEKKRRKAGTKNA